MVAIQGIDVTPLGPWGVGRRKTSTQPKVKEGPFPEAVSPEGWIASGQDRKGRNAL